MTWRLAPASFQSACGVDPSRITVFCDLDGPLVDVSHRYYRTYELALSQTRDACLTPVQAAALTPLSRHQFWEMKRARVPDMEIAMRSGLQDVHIHFFLTTVKQLVNQPELLRLDRTQLEVGYALAQLRVAGFNLAVVTLRSQQQAVHVLRQFDLDQWFSTIRGTQDDGVVYDNYVHCKQTLLAELLADTAFATSEQYWMIGDTEADVLAAQALGVSTIALTCGMRSRAYLERLQPSVIAPSVSAAAQGLLGALTHSSSLV